MSGMSQKQKDEFAKLEKRVGELEEKIEITIENVQKISAKCEDIIEANLNTIEALKGKKVITNIPLGEIQNATG